MMKRFLLPGVVGGMMMLSIPVSAGDHSFAIFLPPPMAVMTASVVGKNDRSKCFGLYTVAENQNAEDIDDFPGENPDYIVATDREKGRIILEKHSLLSTKNIRKLDIVSDNNDGTIFVLYPTRRGKDHIMDVYQTPRGKQELVLLYQDRVIGKLFEVPGDPDKIKIKVHLKDKEIVKIKNMVQDEQKRNRTTL